MHEPRDRFHGKALCVVQPGSTREIAEVLKLCHETSTPVVPQGGNTGSWVARFLSAPAIKSCFRLAA